MTLFSTFQPPQKKSPIEQSPSLKLKPLPGNLKYAFLESLEKLLIIILSKFESEQEQKLLQVFRKHKKASG